MWTICGIPTCSKMDKTKDTSSSNSQRYAKRTLRIRENEQSKENEPGYRHVYEVDDGKKRGDRAVADAA